jgi:hypothetical protein
METALTYLERLAQEFKKPETEVMAMAFEAGLRQLWREHILGRYLQGEIPREQAIERVGIDWVDLAERQHAAMTEDLAWPRAISCSRRPQAPLIHLAEIGCLTLLTIFAEIHIPGRLRRGSSEATGSFRPGPPSS